MQLQMTAPLDIGLEQHDASLGTGQEDIFDLEGAEKDLRNGGISELVGEDSDISDTQNEAESQSDSEANADDVAEQKVANLEDELDRLYDAYQQRLRERDAKAKVKQARQKNPELRAEWHGITEESDEEDDAEHECDGWETMQHAKENLADHSSSEDESDNSDCAPLVLEDRKRQRGDYEDDSTVPPKRLRLVTNLASRKSGGTTSAAQVWFSQDVFSGVEGLDNFEDEDRDEPHYAVPDAEGTVSHPSHSRDVMT
jgi:AdoMet-dependent rRNA methyltransferase SPB1